MAESEKSPAEATSLASAALPPPSSVELPSFEAARVLAESRYSCLVITQHRRHIALPPRFLHRKRTGICMQLDAVLRRYSESFQGVPVAYDNIRITNELGDIIDDLGAVHLDIEADFMVFTPKPGKKLVGIINKVASSHMGCLVHGCFNASIPRPDCISIDEWKNLGFQIGDRLVFKVLYFDSDAAGVFCIRGRLCKSSTGTKIPNEKCENLYDEQDDTQEMETAIQTAEVVTGELQNKAAADEIGGTNPESVYEQDRADLGMHASDSSGYHSDRGHSKKKKRKLNDEDSGLPVLSQHKVKKKRKE
ncbi:DNA-directed RNA polymerase I subunit RPA43 [Heteronotia binoei]|uniref:DNA-directed RNA polymerase I subunit RPA43 n=1 Tax=Heteronotia binoei TaxID=13085 RepID=UPI00292E835D|nr:DNA-directed RNA polymerase I subunit RPA43 [Heteronotia binoei]